MKLHQKKKKNKKGSKIGETKKKPKSTLSADNTRGLRTKQTARPVFSAAPHPYYHFNPFFLEYPNMVYESR